METVQPKLHIRLLGGFSILVGEDLVTSLNTRRLQTFLAYLLLHHDSPQPRQHIAFLLWPDSNEDQALANLRNLLFNFRHSLPFTGRYLKADRNLLQWKGDDSLEVDVLQFEQALSDAQKMAREGNSPAQAQYLQKAVDLYLGDLLPGSYEDWILIERESLQQRLAGALETLINLFERESNLQGAINAAQRLLRYNPLHEEIYKRLMELYASSGMLAEALRTYHVCATVLERELGVQPGTGTRETYERLLNSRQRTPIRSAEPSQHTNTGPSRLLTSRSEPALRATTPFTGRATERALLQEIWREATLRPKAVLIQGEAGIGKTRLVEELFNWVTRQGIAAASARCYPIEKRLAFGPPAEWLEVLPAPALPPVWLSEVARLRPEILAAFPNVPPPGPLTEAWQRRRLMEALARALLSNEPLLLTLDDLQWCDSDTFELLNFLLRFDPGARLLLVMTARTEEIDSLSEADPERSRLVAHLLDGLRDADQLQEIDLSPLDQEETAHLAATLSGGQKIESSRIAELYRESEGNPLFIVEMLRSGWLQRSMPPTPELDVPFGNFGTLAQLPPRMARVLRARLDQLSPTARKLVDFAAVIGHDFSLPLLRLASAEDEDRVVSAVDELWRRRIVREQGADGYDFSHDKLRQVTYSMMTAAKRRMLHRKVARALEEAYGTRLEPLYAQLALHHDLGGNSALAVGYYQRAAEAARQLYAHTEAIPLYKRALALLQQPDVQWANPIHNASPAGPELAKDNQLLLAEIAEGLADVLATTGDYLAARAMYDQALGCCAESHLLWKARLLLRVGDTWRAQRESGPALQNFDALDEVLGTEPFEPYEQWWEVWIEGMLSRMMVHYWQREPTEMLTIAEGMRSALDDYGNRLQKAKYYRYLAAAHLRRDRYRVSDECMSYVTTALEETRKTENLAELADATFLMGFCLLCRRGHDDRPATVDYLQQALSLAEHTGEASFQLLSLAYLSVAYRLQGDVERTRETSIRHLAYASSVQVPPYRETAMANLTWVAWKEGDMATAERLAREAWATFPEGRSFDWVVVLPLVAVNLAQGRLADAVQLSSILLKPTADWSPDRLLTAIRRTVEASEAQLFEETSASMQDVLRIAQEYGCL